MGHWFPRWLRWCVCVFVFAASVGVSSGSSSAGVASDFVAVDVGRLLDSRPGFATIDGQSAGEGLRSAGTTTVVQAAGRAGIASDVTALALNVTVTDPQADGFVTVFPCGAVPGVSTVNFASGQTVAGSTVAALDDSGRFCVYTMAATHVIVDVTGSFAGGYTATTPGRLFDSRPGFPTSDGEQAGGGVRMSGSVTTVPIAGRLGIDANAEAVALTVTVTESVGPGFLAVYPCGPRPLMSTVNHVTGQTISNSIIVPLDDAGDVCVFTVADAHVVLDVAGFVPAGAAYAAVAPDRLVDTRFDGGTHDGVCAATGRVQELELDGGAGHGSRGVPATGVGAVVLNVTTVASNRAGFVTIFRPGEAMPVASSLNFAADDLVSNSVIAPVDADGRVSLFVNTGVHVIVDVLGWFPGASTTTDAGLHRPVRRPPPGTHDHGHHEWSNWVHAHGGPAGRRLLDQLHARWPIGRCADGASRRCG